MNPNSLSLNGSKFLAILSEAFFIPRYLVLIIEISSHSVPTCCYWLAAAHGTPFRCAWEDGLLDSARVVQIGLRGTGWSHGDIGWGKEQVGLGGEGGPGGV